MHLSEAQPRRRDKEARPQQLLDAALSLFVEKGFTATRAEEVAKLAGVSKGTLYLYFPSKKELLKAVINEHLSLRIAEAARRVANHQGSAGALLGGMLVQWWGQLYDSPASGVFKLVITEVRNFPEIGEFYARHVIAPAHQLIGGVVQKGIACGEFRAVDVDHAVHSLVLPLVMICLHRHSLGACVGACAGACAGACPDYWHLDGNTFIAQHVGLVLDGLCLRPPAA